VKLVKDWYVEPADVDAGVDVGPEELVLDDVDVPFHSVRGHSVEETPPVAVVGLSGWHVPAAAAAAIALHSQSHPP